MSVQIGPRIDPRSVGKAIADLQYDIRIDHEPLKLSWGTTLPISGVVSSNAPEILRALSESYDLKVGIRMFDGADKVREFRGDRIKMLEPAVETPIQVKLDTDYLRPGPHRCEIDLVIDALRWFGKAKSFDVQVENSDAFIDVKTFVGELSVEELAVTAEDYFKRSIGVEWMYRKPYSLKDIQHNWPQVAALLRGLKFAEGMSVIDFGAGTGWISRTLKNLGLKVYSLDVSESALDMSRRIDQIEGALYPRPPIKFIHFDGRRIPLDDGTVDRVLCNDALHHVPNVSEVIGEIGRVLRPGGIAGFCEPGPRHSLNPRAQSEMKQLKVLENDIDLVAIREMALAAGFKTVSVSLFTPYPVDISFDEWRTLSLDSPSVKRYAYQAYQRMKSNTLFFLQK